MMTLHNHTHLFFFTMSEAPTISSEIQSLKDQVCKKAEQKVFEDFPKKVATLSQALQGPMFSIDNIERVHSKIEIPPHLSVNGLTDGGQPGVKRRRPDEEDDLHPILANCLICTVKQVPLLPTEVPCNKYIEEVIEYLKPEIISAIDSCSDIKLWIQLMIPKIEDGNNFGVSIQEDILSEVTKAESDASTYLDQITRYYSSRGKMVSKLAKYPFLQDYRRSLTEYDEKVFLSFRLILTEVRNIYIVLYDVVHKNFEKLKKPRSVNTSSLY